MSQPAGVALSGNDLFVANEVSGTIGEYNATTGAAINASLVTGLDFPEGIAISGNDLFVTANGTIGEYNATTGAAINASLVTGLNFPDGITISGNDLFVANSGAYDSNNGTIGEYNATTGAAINASLVSGLSYPEGVALSGNNLFVANYAGGTIGQYNATTGAAINASLVSGLSYPQGIAVSGNDLYVSTLDGYAVGEYNATTGAAINASLVAGLDDPNGIAVSGSDLYVAIASTSTIGEYNATTGAAVNASLVAGLAAPQGIALSGNDLFVANANSGAIDEYNATTGATVSAPLVSSYDLLNVVASNGDLFVTSYDLGSVAEYTTSGAVVNASLVSGDYGAAGVAISGSDLFVSNASTGTVAEYTTSGTLVNASLVTGLNTPYSIAVSGNDLFVANRNSSTIGEYNATTGAAINASLVTGVNYPESIALSGNDLFVSNEFGGTIGEYNATTGAAINASLITGVGEPEGIAVSGSNLFVVNGYVDTVGEYSLTNTGASGLDSDNLVIAAPVVTPSGTTNAFDLGGSAVAVDSGVTVTSYDTDLTGATVTIGSGYQSGDTLHFTNQNGISGSYSAGVLTLSGSATPAQYQTALQSVTFSTTSTATTTRSLSIVALDSNDTGDAPSNSAAEQVNIADLQITTSDNRGGSSVGSVTGTVDRGSRITYTVTVTNSGSGAATGLTIADPLPSALTSATYTATETGGASGYTASGSGNIDDTAVSLPAGSTITYTLTATVSPTASGTLSNTPTLSGPYGTTVSASLVNGLNDPAFIALSGNDLFVTNSVSGTIGEYNATTGAVINAALVTGLNFPEGIAISGNDLFVTANGTIGEYNATTGAAINAALVTGLLELEGVAVSGNDLFVANAYSGTIGEYNATTGAVINAALITGLSYPEGIALSGNELFVANAGNGTIGQYNATNGAAINASLVSGLGEPLGIALSGNDLFVTDAENDSIGEYNATTGATIDAYLDDGLYYEPEGIALSGNDLYVANSNNSTIYEFDATTGAAINYPLVAGLAAPQGIALSGGDLFVSNSNGGDIDEYNATTGAPVSTPLASSYDLLDVIASNGDLFFTSYDLGTVSEYTTSGAVVNAYLISGDYGLSGIALSGNDLFVSNASTGTIGVYNATTGAAINASLVTGLNGPYHIALSGNDLFVANEFGGTIGEYNATTGAAINASLVTGLSDPEGIALSGNTLFVANSDGGTVGEYNATTGAAINASVVTGLNGLPEGIALSGSDLFVSTTFSNTVGEYTISNLSASATDTDNLAIGPPVVTPSGSTGQTFTLGSSAVTVDSRLTVTSYDTDLTGATETITNYQAGDTLNFTNQNGISGSYSAGVLTLTGSATPAQYQAALQSVTFSTTSVVKGTRTVDVVALDTSDAGNVPSNTGVDTVVVAIAAPVVTTSDFQTLASFNGTNGALPTGTLTLSGSTFYGTTLDGGAYGDGTIFSIPVTGGTPTTLFSFNGTNGKDPEASLTLDGSTLFGITEEGGTYSSGTIFSIPLTGGTLTTLTSFNGTDGYDPFGSLVLSGSTLYGTTYEGGANSDGTVFSIPVTGGTPTTLTSFNGTNGEVPEGSLTLSGSTLYGTTAYGGAYGSGIGDGTIFSLPVTGGTPATLLSFNGTNGEYPVGNLVLSGSTIYGTADAGGANGDGTIFSIPATGGTPTTLLSFNGTNGANPHGSLTLSGSTLYVMTQAGGANGDGAIVTLPVTGGTPTNLLSFNGTNGSEPFGSLTVSGSILYGMTLEGGASGEGTVFSLNTAGQTYTLGGSAVTVDSGVTVTSYDTDITGATETIANYQSGDTLHFTNQNGITGSYSAGVLTLTGSATPAQYQAALRSVTFSTTSAVKTTRVIDVVALDTNDAGNVPSNTGVDTVVVAIAAPVVTSTLDFQTLASFNGANGNSPGGNLTPSANGSTLYGMTTTGGTYGDGNIFSIPATGGTPTSLYSFTGATDGDWPYGSLTLSADGSTLYGMTSAGGIYADGTIFSIPVTGGSPTLLASFNGADGDAPYGSLTLSANGATLYGMTTQGGTAGAGNIFSIPVTGGTPINLYSFTGLTDGAFPEGDLTLSGSTLYGMTSGGGTDYEGNVFSISVFGGTPTNLASFNGTNGAFPEGSLMLNGGALYGMTSGDGFDNAGTIFVLPIIGGNLTTLYTFNAASNAMPNGSLTLSGSTFYGMTTQGGTAGAGNIFSFQPGGVGYQNLVSFNGTNGAIPFGSLTLSGSKLYGMTNSGGTDGDGTVFSLNAFVTTVVGSPVTIDSGLTVTSGDTDITGALMAITDYESGDALNFTNQNGITGSYASGTLTLTGSATPAQYTAALQSVTFSTTSTNTNARTVGVVADDSNDTGNVPSNTEVETIVLGIGAPIVTTSASTGNTFTVTGAAVAVDSGLTVTSYETDLTGASETITNYQSGDTLNFTNQNGITGSYSAGVLTLTGNATPAQYQAALQSITFSTTSLVKGTRTVDVLALDSSDAGNVPSNTGVDTVVVAIPPVVTPSGATNTYTVGQSSVAVDSGVTITDYDPTLTGATVTISAGSLQSGDALNFTNQGGISGSYNSASGVLTLTGTATVAQYQAALQSVTFSTTSIASTSRTLSIVAIDGSLDSSPAVEQVNVEYNVVTASGVVNNFYIGGAAVPINLGLTVRASDTDLTGATVTITNNQPGDTLNFNSQNGISGNYAGGVLTLSGSATVAQYQTALQSVTFSSPSSNLTTRLLSIVALDANDSLNSSPAAERVNVVIATVNPSGGTNTFVPGRSAVAVDAGVTVTSAQAGLTGATVTITNYQPDPDTLSFTSPVGSGISGSYASGVLTLSGSATLAQYTAALQSVMFSTTSPNTITRELLIDVIDGSLDSPLASESVNVATLPPVVSTSGSTGQTFTLGGSAVAVDSGISVTSSDTDITGASETIANYQSGDSLNYTPIDGITIASNSGGVLTLTGSATPAQYTAALQSVTFSTTSINQSTRTIDVVADDSTASPTTSNTGIDTVNVAIAAPVVTANQTSIASTAGQTVTVDAAVAVTSFDTDVTGSTITIGTGYQSGSDTLHFTTQNGITGVFSAGVLTLSGSATPAQYQTALQSVTFSSTSSSVATRNISIVVDDSGDTGNVNSNTATTQITVSAPVTVTAAYISSTSWGSAFDTYLSTHTNAVTGHVYGSSTLGYALQTGTSAAQTQTLPWTNLNTITVTFSGPVSGVALGSLKLNGGSGGSTPSVTGFTSDGSNTYSWTLSGPLTNNKYAFGIASTSSSYGPAVVDSHGAGISGTFTTGQALPSGNGLAGSSFDFFFDVLPGDANRDAQDNATDINDIRPLASGTRTTSSSYNPYYDLLGAGQINATTLNTVRALTGRLESAAPTNPNSTQGVGTTGFVGLELGAQETGSSSSSSPASSVSNVVSAPASTTTTSTTTTSTTGSGSGGTSSTTGNRDHGRHAASEAFAATDEAVSDFDLADLWV